MRRRRGRPDLPERVEHPDRSSLNTGVHISSPLKDRLALGPGVLGYRCLQSANGKLQTAARSRIGSTAQLSSSSLLVSPLTYWLLSGTVNARAATFGASCIARTSSSPESQALQDADAVRHLGSPLTAASRRRMVSSHLYGSPLLLYVHLPKPIVAAALEQDGAIGAVAEKTSRSQTCTHILGDVAAAHYTSDSTVFRSLQLPSAQSPADLAGGRLTDCIECIEWKQAPGSGRAAPFISRGHRGRSWDRKSEPRRGPFALGGSERGTYC
ncbi:hypothetical protein F4780DRAFT_548107 [Xylariomycetidae sp. FL0641]|nr:hypothetical protein F4780DRAFT_548107 [Xylariomycetidae sp. FL0641]